MTPAMRRLVRLLLRGFNLWAQTDSHPECQACAAMLRGMREDGKDIAATEPQGDVQ